MQISTALRGRGQVVFLLQLEFALCLLAAKILAGQNPAGEAPIRSLFEELGKQNPTLPKRRTLDKWVENLLVALADEGFINLPARNPGGKQPQPKGISALKKITRKHLEKIAMRFGAMEKVRTELFPAENSEVASATNVVTDVAEKPPVSGQKPITTAVTISSPETATESNVLRLALKYLITKPQLTATEHTTLEQMLQIGHELLAPPIPAQSPAQSSAPTSSARSLVPAAVTPRPTAFSTPAATKDPTAHFKQPKPAVQLLFSIDSAHGVTKVRKVVGATNSTNINNSNSDNVQNQVKPAKRGRRKPTQAGLETKMTGK